ncbi:MAG: histidinol dehydrogenase [Gemmatimonadota bacterium]|nr:histidinol dehydrogenase [Gemmatimonadota bacterium]
MSQVADGASAQVPLPGVRWIGACAELSANDRRALFERTASEGDVTIRARTAAIVADVRNRGDDALRLLATELDGVALAELEVPRARWVAALEALEPSLRAAMERSASNIRRIHEAFRPSPQEAESEPGIIVGRRPDALGRIGVYAPGGRAAYPSSVLMGVIPARVAGVAEVVVCSPPTHARGLPSDVVLAAAALAGADRVFALGGAGAIAAMAYGTASVPRVDRIVGPGNAYVAEAKLQVASAVAIDSPAGPSELLVLADDAADPRLVAREMMAQAEHDPLAAVVAVVASRAVAEAVVAALATDILAQPRRDIVAAALAGQGAVLWTETVQQAVVFANQYAAEHLLLLVTTPDDVLPRLRNAGTVFVGEYASVAFGDYMTGANHVLPTGGLARSYSGLSTLDFVRWTTYQRVTREAAARLANDVDVFATAEGLGGHALAARWWRDEGIA